MSKSGGSRTQTTAPDALTSARGSDVWNAAQSAANAPGVGIDPATQQALQGFQGIARQGNLGFSALGGDSAALQQLMNPYQSQVLNQAQAQYGRDQQSTMNGVNDAATAAGAFGGSRHGVATGVALGQLGQTHEQQMADLTSQGYNDAMGRAGSLANMGFSANGAIGDLGSYMHQINQANDPATRKFGIMQSALGSMPQGQTTTQTQQDGGNWLTGLLGAGLTGASLAGSLGWKPFGV
jgi:hypothetical protein